MMLRRLELIRVTRSFGDQKAVDNVSLSLDQGEILCLSGANGAGKSTLLRIAAGVLKPTVGEVLLEGIDPYKSHKDRLSAQEIVCYLGDVPFFYSRLTGEEHLELMAKLKGGVFESRQEIAFTLGLTRDDLARSVETYSLGMKQKLAVAATLGGVQNLVILDEPFSSLDEEHRGIAREMVADRASSGAGILLVSHDVQDQELAERILRLEKGALV